MKTDLIAEIGIDKMGRMYIRPTKALFPLVSFPEVQTI